MPSRLDALGARLLRTRGFVRAPIWFYRHGLGWLFGRRVLMLEHTGRTSGSTRYVVLEVVDKPSADTTIVVSGFGRRAQWYRNLEANPACSVTIGRHRVRAHARFLSDEESAAVLERYQQAHPQAWKRLRGAIEHAVGHEVTGLPMVELANEV